MPQPWEQTMLQLETSYFCKNNEIKLKHEDKRTIKKTRNIQTNISYKLENVLTSTR